MDTSTSVVCASIPSDIVRSIGDKKHIRTSKNIKPRKKVESDRKNEQQQLHSCSKNDGRLQRKKNNLEVLHKEQKNSLLLSYSYQLGIDQRLNLSVGFSPIDFAPVVMLFETNKKPVEIAALDFLSFYERISLIETFFDESVAFPIQNVGSFVITPSKIKSLNTIYIYKSGDPQNKISMNYEEFKQICVLQEFLKNVLFDFQANYLYIKNYFAKYMEYCKEAKILELPQSYFFIPVLSHRINYLRLFSEIPIFCKNTLYENVSQNLYNPNK